MAELHLHFFGPPRIERGGAPVELDTRKAVAVLAFLAVSPDGISTRDTLATLLYPESRQARARATFRRTLSALRTGVGADLLQADRETVSLALDHDVWCDVRQFGALIARCKSHGHGAGQVCADCLPLLEGAAVLYTGDFMTGFSLRDSISFDDWQLFQAESLRRELSGVLERLVRGAGAQGRWQQAIDHCHRWISLDPLHEPGHRRLMQLYAWNGQRSAALRQYRECVRVLDEELGVPPLPETTALYQSIIEGADHTLDRDEDNWELLASAAQPERQPLPQIAPRAADVPRSTSGAFPLVGREAQLTTLFNTYAHAHAGNGQFVLIEGEAGIGKTRLAEEFLHQMSCQGGAVVVARCYEGDARLAYGPVVDALHAALASPDLAERLAGVPGIWLNELRRLTPEIVALQPDLPAATDLDGPGAPARFFEGIAQAFLAALAGTPPGALLLDDVQWADEATLNLLSFLTRRLRDQPLLILVTLRSEQSAPADRMKRLLVESARGGHGVSIFLDRLSPGDVGKLLAQAGLSSLPAGSADRLYLETEGLPLFLVEYLASVNAGKLAASEPWELPGGVRQLLQARVNAASEVGRQLLAAAAVIGRSFAFDLLRDVSGRSEEETVGGLEAVEAGGLIRELRDGDEPAAEPRYDFSHELLRRVIYEDTSLARRRLLHRRAADALSHASTALRDSANASNIAWHLRMAGHDAEAAGYYRLAGVHARNIFANSEALSYFAAALALAPGAAVAGELHEAIGDLLTLQGAYPRAVMAYETAASVNGAERLAHLEYKMGLVHMRQGQWDLADAHFAAAAEAGRHAAAPSVAVLYADWSLCAHRQGESQRAEQLARQALRLAEAATDDHSLARAANALGVLARSQGDLVASCLHLQVSLAAARRMDDLPSQVAALNNLALATHDCGDDAEACRYLEDALALCTKVGDLHRQAALHNNLADLLHSAGRQEEAMAHLKQAVTIFAAIGEQPAQAVDWQPEIWKLVEW